MKKGTGMNIPDKGRTCMKKPEKRERGKFRELTVVYSGWSIHSV